MRIEPRRVHRADGVEEEYWDDEDEDGFEDEDRPAGCSLQWATPPILAIQVWPLPNACCQAAAAPIRLCGRILAR
jgi:hypothetical protein